MTKSELINAVASKANGVTRAETEAAVNTIFRAMVDALLNEERIEVRGFGSFVVRHRSARDARNPKTGAAVSIALRRVPFFTVGKDLRERVNAGRGK